MPCVRSHAHATHIYVAAWCTCSPPRAPNTKQQVRLLVSPCVVRAPSAAVLHPLRRCHVVCVQYDMCVYCCELLRAAVRHTVPEIAHMTTSVEVSMRPVNRMVMTRFKSKLMGIVRNRVGCGPCTESGMSHTGLLLCCPSSKQNHTIYRWCREATEACVVHSGFLVDDAQRTVARREGRAAPRRRGG